MAVNNKLETPFRRESGISDVTDIVTDYRPLQKGTLQWGYIKSIDHQRNVCSVSTNYDHYNNIKSTNLIPNIPLPVSCYGYNHNGEPYGEVSSIAQGSRVLLGYINQDSKQPVILGVYAPDNVIPNLTPTTESVADDIPSKTADLWGNKKVTPAQHVILEKGNGEYYHTFDGFSFIGAMGNGTNSSVTPDYYDPNYNGMVNTDNNIKHDWYLDAFRNFNTGKEYDMNGYSQDMVLLHQATAGNDNHLTKLMVKADGSTENIYNNKVVDNQLLKVTGALFDGYRIQKQLDTKGDNPNVFNRFEVNDDHVQLEAKNGSKSSKFEITPEGAYLDGELLNTEHSITQLTSDVTDLKTSINPLLTSFENAGGYSKVFNQISTNASSISLIRSDMVGLKDKSDEINGFSNWYNNFTNNGSDTRTIKDIYVSLETFSGNLKNNDKNIQETTSDLNNLRNSLKVTQDQVDNTIHRTDTLESKVESNKNNISDNLDRINRMSNYVGSGNSGDLTIANQLSNIKKTLSGYIDDKGESKTNNSIKYDTNKIIESINGLSSKEDTNKVSDSVDKLNSKVDKLIDTLIDKGTLPKDYKWR